MKQKYWTGYSSVSYRNKKQSFNIFITFFNLYYDCLSMQIKKFFQFFYVHFYFCNINAQNIFYFNNNYLQDIDTHILIQQ